MMRCDIEQKRQNTGVTGLGTVHKTCLGRKCVKPSISPQTLNKRHVRSRKVE